MRNHDFVEAQRLQLILDSLPSSSTHKDLFGLTYSSNGVRTMLWLLHAIWPSLQDASLPTGRLRDTQGLESAMSVALIAKDYVQASQIQKLLQAGNDGISYTDII